jgi:taurine dioxygenase
MELQVRRLCPALGAEVVRIDVSQIDEATFVALRAAWNDAGGVLVLRDQQLTPEQHLAFSRRFGPLFGEDEQLQDTVERFLLPGHPGIYRVSNKVVDGQAQGRARAGTYWHSDVSFRERPAMASLLYAIELPRVGGDTIFASMTRAYESLSAGMQRMLEGLSAVHDFAVRAPLSHDPSTVHPVVITQPETGREALFVNPGFVRGLEGFTPEESAPILGYLQAEATRPEHLYRHVWRPRDLVIWDNRCVMHYAVADYEGDGERYLHRTTVIAERPRR